MQDISSPPEEEPQQQESANLDSEKAQPNPIVDPARENRRQRNRHHARVSRERRRRHERILQESLQKLEQENSQIARQNQQLVDQVFASTDTEAHRRINELNQENLALKLVLFRAIAPILDQSFAATGTGWMPIDIARSVMNPGYSYDLMNSTAAASMVRDERKEYSMADPAIRAWAASQGRVFQPGFARPQVDYRQYGSRSSFKGSEETP